MGSIAPLGDQSVRIGLVGCGRLAEVGYSRAVAGLDQAEIVAVADPDEKRRLTLAARLAARSGREVVAYPSAEALIEGGGIDALLIASPPAAHLTHAELASAAGLPCLVEKPPAADLAEAEAIAALDRPPWIGFNRRFQHGVSLGPVAEGPVALEFEMRYRRESWRPHTVEDGALLDLGPHLVDLALLISGARDAEVRSAKVSPTRVEIALDLAHSTAAIRCATDRPFRERLIMRGPGRRRASSVTGGPARALLTRLPGVEHPLVASLRAQVLAFAAAVRGAESNLLASAADGVRVMRIIDAAARWAARNAPSPATATGPA